MHINEAFPSKYLRTGDLPNKEIVNVVIDNLQVEDLMGNGNPSDKKPVLSFQGKSKGLVLNKTNANIVSDQYGDETDAWKGKPVGLYATETEFRGKMVPCVRIKIPNSDKDLDPSDIPF